MGGWVAGGALNGASGWVGEPVDGWVRMSAGLCLLGPAYAVWAATGKGCWVSCRECGYRRAKGLGRDPARRAGYRAPIFWLSTAIVENPRLLELFKVLSLSVNWQGSNPRNPIPLAAPAGLLWTAIAENPRLLELFKVLSLSVDRLGKVYVSTMEAGNYPITATQWCVPAVRAMHAVPAVLLFGLAWGEWVAPGSRRWPA